MRLDRSVFETQCAFARRASDVLSIPLTDAMRRFTTFYWVARDNDAGRPQDQWDFDPGHPAWVAFVTAVEAGADPVEYVHTAHLAAVAVSTATTCFEYDYWPDLQWVRIHFGNSPDGLGLDRTRLAERAAELRAIFTEVRERHPDAQAVRGCSWLYHVPAYASLFPAQYIHRMSSAGHLHQFAALWGQFIDRHGAVKAALGQPFLVKVQSARSLDELNRAFSYDVLAATGPIDVFYRHFEIGA